MSFYLKVAVLATTALSYAFANECKTNLSDPFCVSKSFSQTKPKIGVCDMLNPAKEEFSLAMLIDFAICNNPSAKTAWVQAAIKAESLGAANSSYLPSANLSAKTSSNKSFSKGGSYSNPYSSSLELSYILYDFGAREANLEYAKQTLGASVLSANFEVESIFLEVTDAYYEFFATKASLASYKEAKRAAKESYEAAKAKYEAGAATPADKLQALTAYSQASLNVVKANAALENAKGALSFAVGLDATSDISILSPSTEIDTNILLSDVNAAIEEAKKNRADLVSALMQIKAAKAAEEKERADGKGTLTLSASVGYDDSSAYSTQKNGYIGASLNIPLFTGFNSTYKIRAAKLQTKQKELEYQKLQKQISLETFKAYNELILKIESIKASKDLVNSAKLSEQTANGRYKAGVGGILDLINAQSALASANQQYLDAVYGLYKAKAAFAYAVGKLNINEIENIGGKTR